MFKSKTFSFYIPKFTDSLSGKDEVKMAELYYGKPWFLIKPSEAQDFRNTRQWKKAKAKKDAEFWAAVEKLEKQVDTFTGYAEKRIGRDWEWLVGYEEEVAELHKASAQVKSKLRTIMMVLSNGFSWRHVADRKAEVDQLMDSVWRYRRDENWEPPFPVMFEWNGGQYERPLPPVQKKPVKWEPRAKTPATWASSIDGKKRPKSAR